MPHKPNPEKQKKKRQLRNLKRKDPDLYYEQRSQQEKQREQQQSLLESDLPLFQVIQEWGEDNQNSEEGYRGPLVLLKKRSAPRSELNVPFPKKVKTEETHKSKRQEKGQNNVVDHHSSIQQHQHQHQQHQQKLQISKKNKQREDSEVIAPKTEAKVETKKKIEAKTTEEKKTETKTEKKKKKKDRKTPEVEKISKESPQHPTQKEPKKSREKEVINDHHQEYQEKSKKAREEKEKQKQKESEKMKTTTMTKTTAAAAVTLEEKPMSIRIAEEQLRAAKFRMLNEQLYSTTSQEAVHLYRQTPSLYQDYHQGFRTQVEQWPSNPLDFYIAFLKRRPKLIVGDFGCGEAKLGQSVKNKVHSFDLVAVNEHITACDMRKQQKVPLDGEQLDVAIFCLSLMGTNYVEFLAEAHRVLKPNGSLKIAEVKSRFSDLQPFKVSMAHLGFDFISMCMIVVRSQEMLKKNEQKDEKNKMFVFFDFEKSPSRKPNLKKANYPLKPCVYKRR